MKGNNTADDISVPLLLDEPEFVNGFVDYKGCPSVRLNSGCWKSSAFITGAGVAERFAYCSICANLVSYLTGSLGKSTASAASIANAWNGIAALLPILGALVADSLSARYKTILVASVVYITALGFLSLSASLNPLKPSNNNTRSTYSPSPNQLQLTFFFVSLYMVALAQGGHTPCVQAFGADQFDEEDESENRAKSSFFNWWFFFIYGGMLVPLLCITYIQDHYGWVLGFGIQAVVMAFASIIFIVGTPTYRFRVNRNGKNPFLGIIKVFVKAAKNWWASHVDQEASAILSQENSQYKFLNKALITSDCSVEDGYFCSVIDVEDAESILRLIPIWFAILGYSIIYAQPSTMFTKQASTMNRHVFSFEIPAASFQQYFIQLPAIIFVLMYDRIFVPIAREITKKPSGISILQRIGVGLFLSLVSIVYAAFVEQKRLATAVEYGLVDMPSVMIPMSALWLVPQYTLSAAADVFTMIGLQEFFYDQVPCDLKSIGLAMYLSILGVGSLLSSFIVSFIQNVTTIYSGDGWFADNLNRAHFDYFYWLLAGMSTVEFLVYVYYASSYVYRRRL